MAGRRGNREGSIYQRSSDGRWMGEVFLGYGPDGRPRRKSVSARTRAEVTQKVKALQRQVDDGLPVPDAKLTVKALLDRWHADVLRHQVSPTAADNYRSVAGHHLVPALGRTRVDTLTVGDVDRLMSEKLDAGFSVSTVRRMRAVLSQAIDQGIRWGVVNRNVVALTRGPRAHRKEGRTLIPEQARTLLAALTGHRNEALYVLMVATGMRRGEVLGLRWSDVDLDTKVVLVQRQLKREGGRLATAETKTAKSRRTVNLPDSVVTALGAHRERQAAERAALGTVWADSGHVFTSSVGTPIDPRNLYREFQAICEEAGLGRWHPHELRHSAASLMLAQGVKLQVVSEVLGHASIRMTADVYGHVLAPDRRAAAGAMDEVLWGSSAP